MSFSIFNSNPRTFVVAFLLLLAATAGFALFARHAFTATGDLVAETKAVEMQRASPAPCIYSDYGKGNEDYYKLTLYKAAKPDIVVLGSSRVLEMNSRFFSSSFLNLGRLLVNIDTAGDTLKTILDIHTPKLMLIGLDQYWFNPNWVSNEPSLKIAPVDPDNPAITSRLIGFVARENLWSDLAQSLFSSPGCHFGISARHFLSGFAADGSRYYGELLTAGEPPEDVKFRKTLRRMKTGDGRFTRAAEVSQERFERLRQLDAQLTRAGVEHVFYFPPFAPSISAAMAEDGGYGYVQKLDGMMREAKLPYVSLDGLKRADCDFLDGFHVGDATDARILQHLAQEDARVRAVVNAGEVARVAAEGAVPLTYLTEDFKLPMRDFLQLGCTWPQAAIR